MAGTYNISIEQNATFTFSCSWKDSTGTVINIQNYDAKMQIRKYSSHGDILITLSTDLLVGGIVIDSNNLITVNIDSDVTKGFISDEYVYDLLLIEKTNQEVIRLIEGTVTVSEGVTKLE